jgi:hypothetical protein
VSFASRLEHTVAIVRRTSSGETDYGADEFSEAVLATVKAAIQPKDERELALSTQAGAGVSDHTIYLLPTDLVGSDYILHDQGDCPMTSDLPHMRFEIEGIRNAAGKGHHLEVNARAVQGIEDVTGS